MMADPGRREAGVKSVCNVSDVFGDRDIRCHPDVRVIRRA